MEGQPRQFVPHRSMAETVREQVESRWAAAGPRAAPPHDELQPRLAPPTPEQMANAVRTPKEVGAHGTPFAVVDEDARPTDDEEKLREQYDAEAKKVAAQLVSEAPKPVHYAGFPGTVSTEPPEWFPRECIPAHLRVPRGREVFFVKIRAEWTTAQHKGDRHLILWEISEGEEKLAFGRSLSEPGRAAAELAKQFIRAVDGHLVKWDGVGGGGVDAAWSEFGSRGRIQLLRLFNQVHTLDQAAQVDFFENCVGRVRAG